MSTIAAFEKEIKMQPKFLERFVPQKPLSMKNQKRILRTFNTGCRSTFFVHEIQGNRTDPKNNWKQAEH